MITNVIQAIMQFVACVKFVGIELATSLPVQYDIRKCSSWTRYRRGRGVSVRQCTRTFPMPSCHEHCVRVHLYYLV